MQVRHDSYTQQFDGAARRIISALRRMDESDPLYGLLGLPRPAWEAYKRALQLEGSEGFDPLGDFVYGECRDHVDSLPDFALRGLWRRTSGYPCWLGEGPDVERMREAVADEVWYAVNIWAEQEPVGEDWSGCAP